MRTVWSSCVLAAFVVLLGISTAHAAPVDCEAARCVIASEIDAECPCAEASNHGRYTSCVARVVNRATRERRIPTRCRGAINGCYLRSLCGKPSRVVLCDQPGDGPGGRCRPLVSEDECTAKGGDVVSTCCASCGAATPTPSVPAATATPAGPVATATQAGIPTASPITTTTGAPIATATTVVASATPAAATATPSAPTATSIAATVTAIPASATPLLPTATMIATTPTAGVPTRTPAATTTPAATMTAVATGTPAPTPTVEQPTPTATPFPFLFVGIEAEPDTGPPPLTVQWTSDVSGGTPPYTYRWSFGDGSPDATTPNPLHVYTRLGDFTTTLVVEDATGMIETDDWDVTVELD